MGMMQGLYTGVSGLTVAQRGLTATAHNLSNVETTGYIRQQAVQETSQFFTKGYTSINTMQVGIGVDTAAIYQYRDAFLDASFRRESGRQAFYDTQYSAVCEMEELFGELQGVAFQDSLEELWTSMQELSKEPGNLTARATMVETAISFIERAENISDLLKTYQSDLDTEIGGMVERINQIGDEMIELNNKICFYESDGNQRANDLRDTRNLLLDELAEMVNITYRENLDSRVSISVEGIPFVTEDTCFKMSTVRSNELKAIQLKASGITPTEEDLTNTGLDVLVPVWPAYGYTEVCDLNVLSSSDKNNDIGGLRGLLVTRGFKVGRYTDIPLEPKTEDYTNEFGVFDATAYEAAYTRFESDVRKYAVDVEQSIIVTVQAQFDQLIHGVVTAIDNILCPNVEVKLADGSKVMILDESKAPIGMDPDATMGEALFSRKSVSRYTEPQQLRLADGTVITARVYNQENPQDNYTLYTIGEIEVNQAIRENLSKIPLNTNDGTSDFDIAVCDKLIDIWQEPFATLTPHTLSMNSFYDYYNELVGSLATRGYELRTISENQAAMAENIEEQRMSVGGVSSDEELTNMIKYQHAYSAASRYINVVDQMLEHLLERL
ncbi:MAG: flagellar hook-associated protein FlgK [Oscillospiraceae bacterium]|nr:flagellar hook-associated protein FlgK [Oscillospiraceae bacterium]